MKPRSGTRHNLARPAGGVLECAAFMPDDSALVRLSLAEAADLLRRRELSPVELTEAVLARIDALEPVLNAFTTLAPREEIRAAARAAEREIGPGRHHGVLHPMPVNVKDLIVT